VARSNPDVEAILVAWHDRHDDHHLAQLAALREQAGDAAEGLAAVRGASALMLHKRPATDLAPSCIARCTWAGRSGT
jgi:hypothetical protein